MEFAVRGGFLVRPLQLGVGAVAHGMAGEGGETVELIQGETEKT